MFIVFLCSILVLTACSNNSGPTPIPTSIPWDTNGDGKFTPDELRATVETMRELVGTIQAEKPDLAAKLSAEIAVYEQALTPASGVNLDIYRIQLTANELLTAIQEINAGR